MKHLLTSITVFASICLLGSCSLTYYDVAFQLMYKSRSGMDLTHKTIAAYVIYRDESDSLACTKTMYSFIEGMSGCYNIPISLYAAKYAPGTDYSSTSVSAQFLTEAGSDAVFLSIPADGKEGAGFRVCAYDGMSSEDRVLVTPFFKQDTVQTSSTVKSLLAFFGPDISTGVFRILFYDGKEDWLDAFYKAADGNFEAAIADWMKILEKAGSMEMRAAAEYNIALGCYLTGKAELSEKWLSQAIKDCGGARPPEYMTNLSALNNSSSAEGAQTLSLP